MQPDMEIAVGIEAPKRLALQPETEPGVMPISSNLSPAKHGRRESASISSSTTMAPPEPARI